jgi:hypothetical protein
MRTAFPDEQIAAFYANLIRKDFNEPAAMVQIATYGGKTNTVAPSATAVPQRDSVMKMMYLADWASAADNAAHIAWIREIYQCAYAATGGVPVPNDVTDGCYVNYPDIDLSDPMWNTSGVPWSILYYKDNYARLQQIKKEWDPLNTFRHSQSIESA